MNRWRSVLALAALALTVTACGASPPSPAWRHRGAQFADAAMLSGADPWDWPPGSAGSLGATGFCLNFSHGNSGPLRTPQGKLIWPHNPGGTGKLSPAGQLWFQGCVKALGGPAAGVSVPGG